MQPRYRDWLLIQQKEAEIQRLIAENSWSGNQVIYTDGSVTRGLHNGRVCSVRIKGQTIPEKNSAFTDTTSSKRMEIEAATTAIEWLGTGGYCYCVKVTDSMSRLSKVERNHLQSGWRQVLATSR
jgi:ribonuclease HI